MTCADRSDWKIWRLAAALAPIFALLIALCATAGNAHAEGNALIVNSNDDQYETGQVLQLDDVVTLLERKKIKVLLADDTDVIISGPISGTLRELTRETGLLDSVIEVVGRIFGSSADERRPGGTRGGAILLNGEVVGLVGAQNNPLVFCTTGGAPQLKLVDFLATRSLVALRQGGRQLDAKELTSSTPYFDFPAEPKPDTIYEVTVSPGGKLWIEFRTVDADVLAPGPTRLGRVTRAGCEAQALAEAAF